MIRALLISVLVITAFAWAAFPTCAGMICMIDFGNIASSLKAFDTWQDVQGIAPISMLLSLLVLGFVYLISFREISASCRMLQGDKAAGTHKTRIFSGGTITQAISEGRIKIQ